MADVQRTETGISTNNWDRWRSGYVKCKARFQQFVITAYKEGFQSVEETIIILKGVLSVTVFNDVIQENEAFEIMITDEHDQRIPDALVYFDGVIDDSEVDTTDANGMVSLQAP